MFISEFSSGESSSPDVRNENLWLMLGDCLNRMKEIPDGSVDMVLCDLPYGTTACKWDTVISFESLWTQYRRIAKPSAAIVLTASQPFTSALISSNLAEFKYCWIWEKTRPSNFFAAKFQPLNNTEDVVVFSRGGCNNGARNPMTYYPQGIVKIDRVAKNSNTGGMVGKAHKTSLNDGRVYHQTSTGYPKKSLKFNAESGLHPTQKPVALMEYLIRTYTNEGETVMDNCMGSGTTGIACIDLDRKFIGIEKDEGYFDISKKRIYGSV